MTPGLSRLSRTYERSFRERPSITLAITNGSLKCFGDFLAQLMPCLLSGDPFAFDPHRSLRFLIVGVLHGPCVGKWHEFLEHWVPLIPSRSTQTALDSDLQAIEAEKAVGHSQNAAGIPVTRPPYPSIRSRPHSMSDGLPAAKLPSEANSTGYPFGSRRNRAARFGGILKRLLLDQLIMAPLFIFVFISLTGVLEGLGFDAIRERFRLLYWHILTANWKIWPLIQIINFNFMPLQYRVPWQSSCGVLWTVFLSLSTHSTSNLPVVATAATAKEVLDQIKSPLVSQASRIRNSTRAWVHGRTGKF